MNLINNAMEASQSNESPTIENVGGGPEWFATDFSSG